MTLSNGPVERPWCLNFANFLTVADNVRAKLFIRPILVSIAWGARSFDLSWIGMGQWLIRDKSFS
jgi:hypothetical protein